MKGLSNNEAHNILTTYGYNELPDAKPKRIWEIAFEVMREPMFILLIVCGGLYITLGDVKEGFILLSSIIIIITITFLQHQKTEKALEALKKLSSPRVLVIRDGLEIRIPGRELVPGDLMIIREGDRIAGDAEIVNCLNLTVDESIITGESLHAEKDVEKNNVLYSGTLVTAGSAFAITTRTGINTEMGKIAKSLNTIEESPTRLQKEMKLFIKQISIAGIFISICVVTLFYFTRGNFIQSLLNGLSSSMAILPEEFPVVLTVFLALGSWRLSKKNVLTRKPSTIETLGSATVLCSDKTGTITQNQMQVSAIAAYNMEIISHDEFSKNFKSNSEILISACYASKIDTVDPMEKAFFKAAEQFNVSLNIHKPLIKEYPLTKDLLAISRVYKEDEFLNVYTKGAPESIFMLCMLNSEETSKELHKVEELAKRGYRVLGVARGNINELTIPDSQKKLPLTYLGLIALEDPIRPEVPSAIKECYSAGIKIMMITGDYPSTAKSIAKQAGLKNDYIITGEELNKLNDEELTLKIESVHIFARVRPDQKLRIVNALKANNEVVAMTGDGVNDAPALKAAHIGIAMGNKGTDVAREASSLVLLDDNFASIVSAIRLGRRIFDNLQKAMSYILAIHIPIIGLTLIPAFYEQMPLFLFPLHIVFMELIIDPICSIAFESEEEEKGIMNRPPRKTDLKFFGFTKISFSLIQGLLLLITVLIVHFISINEGHTEGEVRAIAFTTLIIGNIFLIITNLSNTRSFKHLFTQKSKSALFIITGSIIILLSIHSFKFLQNLFHFEYPGLKHFVPSVLASLSLLFILESRKLKYLFTNGSKS